MEGQGKFLQPPSDNYDLDLDPYEAARFFVLICSYEDGTVAFDYAWTKDGANFQPSTSRVGTEGEGAISVEATVPIPKEEYDSSLEGTYTCRVSLGGATRGSRNIIVTLPGEPRPVCTSPTSHMHMHSLRSA